MCTYKNNTTRVNEQNNLWFETAPCHTTAATINTITPQLNGATAVLTHLQQRAEDPHEEVRLDGQVGRQPLRPLNLVRHVLRGHDGDRLEAVPRDGGVRLRKQQTTTDEGTHTRTHSRRPSRKEAITQTPQTQRRNRPLTSRGDKRVQFAPQSATHPKTTPLRTYDTH